MSSDTDTKTPEPLPQDTGKKEGLFEWVNSLSPKSLVAKWRDWTKKRADDSEALKVQKTEQVEVSENSVDYKTLVRADGRIELSKLRRDGRIYNPFAWTRLILVWTNIHTAIIALLVLILWFAVFLLAKRDYMVIDLPPSLAERIETEFGESNTSRDSFDRSLVLNLQIMNQHDFSTQPNVALLRGAVNPDIYTKVLERYNVNKATFQAKGIIQNLTVTKIENVFRSVNGKRLSATVRGYLTIVTFPDGKNKDAVIIPYRARVVVLVQPKSRLNPERYYLLQVEEASGQENVRLFDQIVEKQLKEKGLK